MNRKTPATVLCVLLAMAAGCAVDTSMPPPAGSTKFTLEHTDRFVAMDRPAQQVVTCTGLQERPLADGRLEVVANMKNRESRAIRVQASCLFRDEQGVSMGAESSWQTVLLGENATEAVRFIADDPLARNYTVRVRTVR